MKDTSPFTLYPSPTYHMPYTVFPHIPPTTYDLPSFGLLTLRVSWARMSLGVCEAWQKLKD